MSVSLYRKYRSKSLDEIVGQKGVVKALKAAINNNSLSHAYLFTGPRGVGKTSIARILAFEINKTPYDSKNLPVDIIEIDAASNRGIEEIRDLREKVKIAPISSPYKVYIIDEVHMLTTPAFNALLKTLEEPPEHVIFILATTEGHKLPETIISRTQRYNFSLASLPEVTDHLQKIAKLESIDIDKEAIELVAIHSGGSMRDALSTLDHVRHLSDKITVDEVRLNIGLPSQEIIDNLLAMMANNDAPGILNTLQEAEQENISAAALANNIIYSLKTSIQNNTNKIDLTKLTKLIKSLSEVESSNKPNVLLTIALLGSLNPTEAAPVQAQPIKQLKTLPKQQPEAKPTAKPTPKLEPQNQAEDLPAQESTANAEISTKEFNQDSWQEILEDIRSTHNTLYSVLRIASLDTSDIANNKVSLNFEFPFHQKRINEQKNKAVLNNKFKQNGYGNLEVICGISDKKPKPMPEMAAPAEQMLEKKEDVLSQIRGVFDGAEAME